MSDTAAPQRLEFAFDLRVRFTRAQNIHDMPTGAGRGAVYVDGGEFEGPRIKGTIVPNSGGDYALFRPDNTISFDARYMLQEADGTLIMIYNAGFLWGHKPDTMQRLREWAFNNGPPVDTSEYYLRSQPRFEAPAGKHDWLTRHVFVGFGERRPDGNVQHIYAVV